MPRFFVDAPPEGSYFLDGEAGRHGAKALRLRPGEAVTLCDGQGTDWPCRVEENTGEGLLLQVRPPQPNQSEPRTRVTVCQCLPKGDKLETVVQKAVELGAMELWPIESARCVSRPDQKSAAKKRDTLSLHDALPIWRAPGAWPGGIKTPPEKSWPGCRRSPWRPPCRAAGESSPRCCPWPA